MEVQGCSMFRLVRKLKMLKPKLKNLNHERYSGLRQKADLAKKDLEHIQDLLQSDMHNASLLAEERDAINRFTQTSNQLRAQLRQ